MDIFIFAIILNLQSEPLSVVLGHRGYSVAPPELKKLHFFAVNLNFTGKNRFFVWLRGYRVRGFVTQILTI